MIRLRRAAFVVAGAALACHAVAQVKPIPEVPIGVPSTPPARPEPQRPTGPVAPLGIDVRPRTALPVLSLVGSAVRTPGAEGDFTMELRGLRTTGFADVKAAHVIGLQFGCRVDAKPGIGGMDLREFRQSPGFAEGYSTFGPLGAGLGQTATTTRVLLHQPSAVQVAGDGVLRFTLLGVAGTSAFRPADGGSSPAYGGDLRSAPEGWRIEANSAGTRRGAGYEVFMRTVDTVTASQPACIPSAFIALLDAKDQWFMLDQNGQRLALGPASDGRSSFTINHPNAADPRPVRLSGMPWRLAPHRVVTIENTVALRARFNVESRGSSAGAVCSGQSGGPAGSFAVGAVERQGDLAWVARSGPVGTRCIFAYAPAELPQGVKLRSARFGVARVGDRCGLNGTRATVSDLFNAMMLAASPGGASPNLGRIAQATQGPVIITGEGDFGGSDHVWLNPYVFPDPGIRYAWRNLARPMTAAVECDATLANDNEIALIMQRATFEVPEGVAFP